MTEAKWNTKCKGRIVRHFLQLDYLVHETTYQEENGDVLWTK